MVSKKRLSKPSIGILEKFQRIWLSLIYNIIALVDPKGGACPLGIQILSFSCSFWQKHRLAHPLWELVPPQENPGTAAELCSIILVSIVYASKYIFSQTTIHGQISELCVLTVSVSTIHQSADPIQLADSFD